MPQLFTSAASEINEPAMQTPAKNPHALVVKITFVLGVSGSSLYWLTLAKNQRSWLSDVLQEYIKKAQGGDLADENCFPLCVQPKVECHLSDLQCSLEWDLPLVLIKLSWVWKS